MARQTVSMKMKPAEAASQTSGSRPILGRRAKVFHLITKLELGGAQKVTLMTLERLPRESYALGLISGSGGLLCERAKRIPDLERFWIPSLVREVRPWKDLRALFGLWRLFRKTQPDIVHTHSSKAGVLGRWAAWFARVPIIFHTAHGFGFNDYQGPLARRFYVWIERITRRITTQSVVVSRANAGRAESLGILKPGEWLLSRDSISVDEFMAATRKKTQVEAWGIPPERLIVGMVACFKPQKSPVDFVEIARYVLEKRQDVHFVMAGDGELRTQVEGRIREHALDDHITLLGWQHDMPEVYRNLDVFVLTSLWEGQPCVYAEAMASGLPIVATDVDGAREAILNSETGFIHSHRDVEGMASSILRLMDSAALRTSMGAAGRSRVWEFDIGLSVSTLESAYRACLEHTSDRRQGSCQGNRLHETASTAHEEFD